MTEVQFAKQFLTTLDSKNTKYQSDHVFDPKTFQTRIPYTLPKLSSPPHPLPPQRSTAAPPAAPGSQPASTPSPSANLTLKSTRNPNFTLYLPSTPLSTPITTLRTQIHHLLSTSTTSIAVEKIKILHNKKPIPATKTTIADVLDSSSTIAEAEFGIMILGGAADPIPNTQTIHLNEKPSAPGPGSENAAIEAITGVNPEDAINEKAAVIDTTAVTEPMDIDAEKAAAVASEKSQPIRPGDSSGKEVLTTAEFWNDLQGFLEQRLRDKEEAARLRGVFEQVVKSS